MPRRASKTDANQAAIVDALRRVGASVQDLSGVGGGVPDLCVGYHGQTYLLEIKTPNGTLTPDQERWHPLWRGHVAIVRSVQDAWKAIGVTAHAHAHDPQEDA